MSTRHLLHLTRRPHRPLTTTTRLHSTATVTTTTTPSLPYDHISSQLNSKLKRLQNPNPNYLKHNTPHPTSTNHTPILTFPPTHLTTLPTGLRVASEANLASRTATVGAWVASGSRFETRDATHGVAHFVQHMFLKGTYNRKIRELEKEVENMGGHLYGYTGRENTSVYMKVMARDVAKAVEILADVVQDSEFHEWLIKPTRKDILREIEEVPKDPEEVIFDHLHATAFQHTPLGRTILGPAENIQKITRKDMLDYMATHFTPHRMVISASGAVKHEDLVEQVKKLFTKLSANPLTTTQLVEKEPAIFTGSEIRMRDDDAPLAHFAVAFNGASSTDPDSVALMVMQEMLGSWKKSSGAGKHMGSQLAQLVGISELAESMKAFNTNYKDTGLFGVYAVAKPDCLDDLAFAIMQEISKLCYRVIDEDVIRAQNQLKSLLLLNLDGSFHTADEIGRQLISYGRRIPFVEMFARIDAVDAATIKRVANRFIFDQDIAIAASGPVKLLPDYNWFRRHTYMLRY